VAGEHDGEVVGPADSLELAAQVYERMQPGSAAAPRAAVDHGAGGGAQDEQQDPAHRHPRGDRAAEGKCDGPGNHKACDDRARNDGEPLRPGVSARSCGMENRIELHGKPHRDYRPPSGRLETFLTPARRDRRVLAAFSVTPLGVSDSVGDLVADAVRIVRESGLPSETNAMFTNIEGDWDEVMAVIHRCVDAVAARAPRVSVVIKIDHRPTVDDALHKKVERIERKLAGDGENEVN
jgi:uncharacterized protein (TIGR00106 family)